MITRKFFIFFTAMLLTLVLLPFSSFAEEQPIKVFVSKDQINFDVNPIIEEGTTLVQFRPLFEKFGLKVDWNDDTKTVTGTRGKFKVELTIDSKIAKINGVNKELAIAPTIVDGSTLVPLRFIGEATERDVLWSGATRTIKINNSIASTMSLALTSGLLKYEGAVSNNLAKGQGKLTLNGEVWYEGSFQDGHLNGKGKVIFSKDTYYEGDFLNDRPHGKGVNYIQGKLFYEGDWKNGKMDGIGKAYNPGDATILYEGEFSNNAPNGKGKLYDNGDIYEGEVKYGKPDGIGKTINKEGKTIQEGTFSEGKLVKKLEMSEKH
ncbi:hypothetical protein FE783_35865 [Paenibacillus mesophilus]|uniref:stalk domain-containing protein n=1 Tax=Paenibacillus mesophilus TaxID=2582849 RepID=UPI00110DC873|nr:stalk domain-containing protein [Paenibacillus mesophilus]TMV43196.1 hypothetical protein FE783_35865 [Paenibacillus mesophilus]